MLKIMSCTFVHSKFAENRHYYATSQYRDHATGWTTGVQFPAGAVMIFLPLCHRVQTDTGAHTQLSVRWLPGLLPLA